MAVLIRLLLFAGLIWFLGRPIWRAWRQIWGRSIQGRVWLAREGLVEESAEAVVLFPWNRVYRFDQTELHGRLAVRVWLNDAPDLQFRLLNIHLPDNERQTWVNRRVAGLHQSRQWTSADLM